MSLAHSGDMVPKVRLAGAKLARGYCFLASVYLLAIVSGVLEPELVSIDRVMTPVFYVASLLGLVYAIFRTPKMLKMVWLYTLTVCCLGRGFALLFSDIGYLTTYQQVAASISWILVWLGAVLSALILTADEILRGE